MVDVYGYQGKRVLVTGGGGAGMGAAAVRQLVEQGAEVHVVDLREPPVEVASFLQADLSDPEAITGAVDQVGGRLDALFNCVGVPGNRTPPLLTMLINFAGVRQMTEAAVARMERGGAVVTVASQAGAAWGQSLPTWLPLVKTEGFAAAKEWLEAHPEDIANAYQASKEALVIWTQYAASVWGPQGIRVNVTMPGPTQTPMSADFVAATSQDFMDNYPIPLGRAQTPDEQASALLFLNSAAAGAITGAPVLTDGGANASLVTEVLSFPAL